MQQFDIVISVLPEPIILTASHTGPAVISCTLTGFDTNPPYVEYVWLRNGLIIATIEQAYASVGGDDGLNMELNKYQVTSPELGKSSLTIDPVCEYKEKNCLLFYWFFIYSGVLLLIIMFFIHVNMTIRHK